MGETENVQRKVLEDIETGGSEEKVQDKVGKRSVRNRKAQSGGRLAKENCEAGQGDVNCLGM